MLKRKTSYIAATLVAALGGLGGTNSAQAVVVNPDGLGQVLLYPYYTVRAVDGNVFNTYLSVTNTSTQFYKAIKVRFMEGNRSQEVLDFNVYLSPNDVWTAAVLPVDATNLSLGGKMVTADNSCLVPGDESGHVARNLEIAFLPYAFQSPVDGGSTSLERSTEGHFEIIEMADFLNNVGINGTTVITAANPTVVSGLLHNTQGVPTCSTIGGGLEPNIVAATTQGTGGLFGSAVLINVENGISYGYDPVALNSWNMSGAGVWSTAGSLLPNLGNVSPQRSTVFANGAVYVTNWATGFAADTLASGNAFTSTWDAVSAVLMHENVVNEFMMDDHTNSGTDWVVTFPTKTAYVAVDTAVGGGPMTATTTRAHNPATRPFQEDFWGAFDAAGSSPGSCDQIALSTWDREEAIAVAPPAVSIPSPPPPAGSTPAPDQLCWETNVISFIDADNEASNNLGSQNVRTVNTGYENGWMLIHFPDGLAGATHAHVMPDNIAGGAAGNTTVDGVAAATVISYYGLPTIGIALQDWRNDTTTNRLRSFGAAFQHKGDRGIR